MYKFSSLIFCILVGPQMFAEAANYKGFPPKKESGMKAYVLSEYIVRFTETPNEFLILLDKHAAFYRFPKKTDSAADFRSFLNKRIASKSKIRAVVNPRSTEISKISDLE